MLRWRPFSISLCLGFALHLASGGAIAQQAPSNDNYANAIVISSLPFSHVLDTSAATTEATDPMPCGALSNSKSVWYRYTPTQSGFVNAHTFGSKYDTVLEAYTGTPGSFVPLACNDDQEDFFLQSLVSIPVVAGTTYSFMVSAYRGDGGTTEFHLTSPHDTLTRRRGDYDGDSRTDITWEHTSGSSAVWLMNGVPRHGAAGLLGPSTGWSVRALPDLDGNGTSDIVWQHTDGSVAGWLMNGFNLSVGGLLPGPGDSWSLRTVGDFNGDGKSDFVWQHVGGATNVFLMNGLNLMDARQLLPGGTGWAVRTIGDFDGAAWPTSSGSIPMEAPQCG